MVKKMEPPRIIERGAGCPWLGVPRHISSIKEMRFHLGWGEESIENLLTWASVLLP